MSIDTSSNIGIFAAGVPARLSHPVAIWGAEIDVTGDATGGIIGHAFTIPIGLERTYVVLVDWITLRSTGTPGQGRLRITQHHESASSGALGVERDLTIDMVATVGQFEGRVDVQEWLRAIPNWWRRDFGGTAAERLIIQGSFTTNTNLATYSLRAGGRLWDARVLASVDFHLMQVR